MPAPSALSSDTQIASASATTQVPIANCAPRKRSIKNESGTATAAQNAVASSMPR